MGSLSWYHFGFGGFSIQGVVLDSVVGLPIAGARVWSSRANAATEADGSFDLGGIKPTEVVGFDAPGYRGQTLRVTTPFDPLRPRLEPIGVEIEAIDADNGQPVRAVLEGPTGASTTIDGRLRIAPVLDGQRFNQDMYRLLDTTEVNAVVIDVKGDYGLLSYTSRAPLAEQIGANSAPTIDDLDGLLLNLHQHGAYAIARIVVFKDNILARNGPRAGVDVGIRDRRMGEVWVDGEGLGLSMDTFGYTTWWDDDGGIGQDLDILSEDIDYYCPMVYPSTFTAGVPGQLPYPDVVSRPYDTVYQSLKHVQQKLAGKRVVVRPWLQYFDDYPWATKFRYDAPQIEAQKQAVADSRSFGWMLWNAGSLFKRGGLAPKP